MRAASFGFALLLALGSTASALAADTAYVRVNQLGYPYRTTARAWLMSTALETGATFQLIDAKGTAVASGTVPTSSRAWNKYHVYPLDFVAARPGTFTLAVNGAVAATSPAFRINTPSLLYSKALANGLAYFQNQRDGANYVPTTLRTAPAHRNDAHAGVYVTPTFDSNDNVVGSLAATGAVIDASGGWADAGDYLKFVETHSYTVAMMLVGVRDFPAQMGPPSPSDFTTESSFGIDWLLKMWDDSSRTLYYQAGIGAVNANIEGDHDLWRLPQGDDTWGGGAAADRYIRNRPVFIAAVAGSKISPNIAGRLASDFALCYQVYRLADATRANKCLLAAEHIFDLANTAPTGNLLTTAPFDFYPEAEWRDDMELGATELYLALHAGGGTLPAGLPHTNPAMYLSAAATWAHAYITGPNDAADSLNLYDVSGLAHFELYRTISLAGSGSGLAVTQAQLLADLQQQLGNAEATAATDPFGFGFGWNQYDSATHGAGLAVTAAEVAFLTHAASAATDEAHWAGNILGANSWGASFIIGDGKTFPFCPQHQVANLAGHLNGTSPILVGALVEGPNSAATGGAVTGMRACPANGIDVYAQFNGRGAVFKDFAQSFSTVEPAIDLTAPSLLMFAWQIADGVAQLP